MSVLAVCMQVNPVYAILVVKAEEGTGSHGTKVKDSSETPCNAETEPESSEEQQVITWLEPCLQPHTAAYSRTNALIYYGT